MKAPVPTVAVTEGTELYVSETKSLSLTLTR